MSMTDDAVTIRASTRHEEKEEKGEYRRRELSRGEFQRVVVSPAAAVKGAEAKAAFKDGSWSWCCRRWSRRSAEGRARHPLRVGRRFTSPASPRGALPRLNDRSPAPLGVPMRRGAG